MRARGKTKKENKNLLFAYLSAIDIDGDMMFVVKPTLMVSHAARLEAVGQKEERDEFIKIN
jgi:hypothetical protein